MLASCGLNDDDGVSHVQQARQDAATMATVDLYVRNMTRWNWGVRVSPTYDAVVG